MVRSQDPSFHKRLILRGLRPLKRKPSGLLSLLISHGFPAIHRSTKEENATLPLNIIINIYPPMSVPIYVPKYEVIFTTRYPQFKYYICRTNLSIRNAPIAPRGDKTPHSPTMPLIFETWGRLALFAQIRHFHQAAHLKVAHVRGVNYKTEETRRS